MSNREMARRVTILAMGGTIAMTRAPDGGVIPALSATDLVSVVPGLADLGVDLEVVDVRRLPGASLGFADLDVLYGVIAERFAAGSDGVVVTQGTDTIEETAYVLDLIHRTRQPIVVTGAMRNPTLAGADGPANILAAITTAASPTARGLGCLVVFADEIHAAVRVRKTHATSPATFVSPNTGPMGHLVEGQPVILVRPTARYTLPEPMNATDCRVGLYTVTLGDDDAMLRAAVDHLDGLVVAGFGVGHVPERLVPVLDHLASTVPVVLASRDRIRAGTPRHLRLPRLRTRSPATRVDLRRADGSVQGPDPAAHSAPGGSGPSQSKRLSPPQADTPIRNVAMASTIRDQQSDPHRRRDKMMRSRSRTNRANLRGDVRSRGGLLRSSGPVLPG